MQTLRKGGLSLSFDDIGTGLPVLLFHAFPLNSGMFRAQVEALSGRFRFILLDARGFGNSEASPGPLDMQTIAEDGLELLDFLQIDSAVVGGVSMGGYAAMAFLRQEPSRVRALLLMDTQAQADDEAAKARREETAHRLEKEGSNVLGETLLPKLISPSAPVELRESLHHSLRSANPQVAANAQRGMGRRLDSRELLTRFAGPALVMVGAQDELTPPIKARNMSNLLTNSHYVEIAGAGHLPNMERPAETNLALGRFLESLQG